MCIWLNLNLNLEFEFAILLQYTSIKWNCQHISTMYIMFPQIIMCLSIEIIFIPSLIVCSIDVQLEPEATPFVEDTVCEPRQQGKQTPLIMSIKSQFPLSLAYACLGDHLVIDSTA